MDKINEIKQQIKEINLEPQSQGVQDLKQRKKDRLSLILAKELEKTKKEFVYVTKGKITKHVCSSKIEVLVNDGWRIINVK